MTKYTRARKNYFLPLFSTPLLYILCVFVVQFGFAIHFQYIGRIFIDGGVALLLSYALLALARSNGTFLALQTLVFILFFIPHALKISVFGAPVVPDDWFAVSALLNILVGWQFWGLIVFLLIAGMVILSSIRFSSLTAWGAILGLSFVGGVIYYFPAPINQFFHQTLGYTVWSQRINFETRGPFLYTIHELAYFYASQPALPDKEKVMQAQARLSNAFTSDLEVTVEPSSVQRNVYVILLESFWDPLQLASFQFSKDPLSGGFRELWAEGGYASIYSPVFGGYTANAEFEALCGFPVDEDAVKFERRFKNNVPCLPQILRDHGYQTVASHANIASFWNRINIYPRMGFENRLFLNDYQREDMAQNEFMGDSTYYTQTNALIAAKHQANKPLFNYMVTIFGHLPYSTTPSRPPVITVTGGAPAMVEAYANNMYYKSLEVMQEIQHIREADPDALIVMFGDHLPNLGINFSGFYEAGFLGRNKSEFTADMIKNMYRTPLIIIDGQRGVLRTDDMSLFELPYYITQRLGLPASILKYTRSPESQLVRPLPGQNLLVKEGRASLCRAASDCPEVSQWLDDIRILMLDIFEGKQYSL